MDWAHDRLPSAGVPDGTDRSRDVTVGAYRAASEPAVLALLGDAFGRWPTGLDVEPAAFFRWKHESSPFGPSTRLVARVDGEVAGFLALMPWRLRFAGGVHASMRGVDLAVAPGFQRRGVAGALIAASRGNYPSDVALSWSNPNERSRPGVLNAGRKRVDGLPRFVGLGGSAAGTARRLFASDPTPPGDESLAATLADDALLERVLTRPGPVDSISTAHDVDFLRWRYGQQGDYRAAAGELPGSGAGIAIFRTEAQGRFSVARVCELFTESEDEKVVRMLMRQVRQRARTDFLVCAFSSSRVAWRCGLLRSSRTGMIAANPLHQGLAPDPTRASAWALSLGDLELI